MGHRIDLPDDLARLKVGGKSLEFWIVQGEAVGSRTRSETHVTSRRNAHGQVARVDSEVVNYSDFYLRLETGGEVSVELRENSSFRVRDGQLISLVCMRIPALNPKKIFLMGVRNRATCETALLYSPLLVRRLSGLDNGVMQGLANLFVLMTIGVGLIPLILINRSVNRKYGIPLEDRVRAILGTSLAT